MYIFFLFIGKAIDIFNDHRTDYILSYIITIKTFFFFLIVLI